MAEQIIPGTYISVRAEGLISAGRIAAGIVGIVGTASAGPVGKPVTLAGFSNGREIFGTPDDFQRPEDGSHPLTLVRALEHLYSNGASSVVAVRVAGSTKASASFALQDGAGHTVAHLTAKTPGTWGNSIRVETKAAEEDCGIENENHTTAFSRLNYAPIVPTPENRIRIFRGITKKVETLDIVYKRVIKDETVTPNADKRFFLSTIPVETVAAVNRVRVLDSAGEEIRAYGDGSILYGAGSTPGKDEIRVNGTTGEIIFAADQVPPADQKVIATYGAGHADPVSGQILATTWDGTIAFTAGEAPKQTDGDVLVASYKIDRTNCIHVSLSYGTTTETYTVPDGRIVAQRVQGSSALIAAEADKTNGGNRPKPDVAAYFGTGSNTPGSNGAEAGPDDYKAALESIENELVNIVVLAGQDAETMGSVLAAHLNATDQTDHERIGVIGAKGSTVAEYLGHSMSHERLILVAPGLAYPDGRTLPSAYTAAAVAGLISSLPVQTSLTNKAVTIPGLAINCNRGQQEQLIKRNVLTIVLKEGFRIVKGITTSGEGTPFSAIPTRRIVDYAKYGVRSASNPYIGRLNNTRVRGALKATLDAFLTRMVEDEALTGYELEVTATRAQEIAGEVSVVMTLQPTFSIEYIRVTMILK